MIVNERFAGGAPSRRPLAPGTQSVPIEPKPLDARDHSWMITRESTGAQRKEPITSRAAVGMKAAPPGRIDPGYPSLVPNGIVDGEEKSSIIEVIFHDRTEVLASLDERQCGSGGARTAGGAERLRRKRGRRDVWREHVGNGLRESGRRGRVAPCATSGIIGRPSKFDAGAQAFDETRPHLGTSFVPGPGQGLRRVARRKEGIAQFRPRFFAAALRVGESLQPAQPGLENYLCAGPALHRPKDHWRQRIASAEGGIPIGTPCPISRLPAGEKLQRRSPRSGGPGRHGPGCSREQKPPEARNRPQEFTSAQGAVVFQPPRWRRSGIVGVGGRASTAVQSRRSRQNSKRGLRHGMRVIGPRPTAQGQAGRCPCAYRPRCAPRAARARPSPCKTCGP